MHGSAFKTLTLETIRVAQLEERIQALSSTIRAAGAGEELEPLAERCDALLK